MECPFCHSEMTKGTLRSKGGNYFLPEGERNPFSYSQKALEKRRGVMLPPDPYRGALETTDWPEAYNCRKCRKIFISY